MTTAGNETMRNDPLIQNDTLRRAPDDRYTYDGLAFFGRVNASISHELKNVMAIISETAGLLGDLSDMAATGSPVPPDMLKSCTGSIMEEIQRGFTVIRQMNRFAHSIDTPYA
jgi:signal transduction histidine kinase